MLRFVLLAATLGLLATSSARADRFADADDTARAIDRLLDARWKADKITPAADADDSEWLRRIYLDLLGRIPAVSEVRAFLNDKRPDRRTRLVESLLGSKRVVTHLTTVWRRLLIPEADANFQVRFQLGSFENWLRDWLESDRGYDVMVKELLTAQVAGGGPRQALVFGGNSSSPTAYYVGKEFKPEELAAATSRIFLGVNLGCAQCHNHPFADWKRDQFWSFAAFFSSIQSRRMGDFTGATGEKTDQHTIKIPNSDREVSAKFLDGKQPEIKAGMKTREVLANWVVSADNPYFARATVNRMWAHFFGVGLSEPLDEMVGTDTKPSQPDVLDALAKAFVRKKYDMRWLMRTITATKAYQRTSKRSHASQDTVGAFARMPLRGLTGEQLFDSLAMATGTRDAGARTEFLNKFASGSDRSTETQTSILQALTLMNGRVTTAATRLESSETLEAIADAPFLSTAEKIEALFLTSLTRKPTSKEMARLTTYVEKGVTTDVTPRGGKKRPQAEALADVFWALLNSGEFSVNH